MSSFWPAMLYPLFSGESNIRLYVLFWMTARMWQLRSQLKLMWSGYTISQTEMGTRSGILLDLFDVPNSLVDSLSQKVPKRNIWKFAGECRYMAELLQVVDDPRQFVLYSDRTHGSTSFEWGYFTLEEGSSILDLSTSLIGMVNWVPVPF